MERSNSNVKNHVMFFHQMAVFRKIEIIVTLILLVASSVTLVFFEGHVSLYVYSAAILPIGMTAMILFEFLIFIKELGDVSPRYTWRFAKRLYLYSGVTKEFVRYVAHNREMFEHEARAMFRQPRFAEWRELYSKYLRLGYIVEVAEFIELNRILDKLDSMDESEKNEEHKKNRLSVKKQIRLLSSSVYSNTTQSLVKLSFNEGAREKFVGSLLLRAKASVPEEFLSDILWRIEELRSMKYDSRGFRKAVRVIEQMISLVSPQVVHDRVMPMTDPIHADEVVNRVSMSESSNDSLPENYYWASDQGRMVYSQAFLVAFSALTPTERKSVAKQLRFLACEGQRYPSLKTKKYERNGIPFSP